MSVVVFWVRGSDLVIMGCHSLDDLVLHQELPILEIYVELTEV